MAKTAARLKDVGWGEVRQLGEGGQSRIHLVRRIEDGDTETLYAAKILKNVRSRQALERFYREIEAVQEISHPGVVRPVDWSKGDTDFHYYVMEYADAATPLTKIVGSEGSPFYGNALRSLDVFVRIVEALAACEAKGVVHRDLSLGNVLITPEDRVTLIDFGCCCVEQGQVVTLTDEAVGTPHYRAPECEGFTADKATIRADLYSAGKILWSLVTNKKAFARERPAFNELSMSRVLPHHPMTFHLHYVFEKTIRRDPQNRYSSASEALEAARQVRNRIEAGFLPLEESASGTCAACGVKKLARMSNLGPNVEGRPEYPFRQGISNPEAYWLCTHCGYATAWAPEVVE